jgi:hypothetical protein
LGALAFLIGTMVRSIVVERTGHRSTWRECFVAEFGQSTFRDLEVRVPAALLVRRARRPRHRRGRAASKDGDETIEAALRRIEERLGTLSRPPRRLAPSWKLPGTPLGVNDEQLATSGATAGRSTPMSPPRSPAAIGAHE